MFAKIQNTSIVKYPYTREMLTQDWPNVSFPNNLDGVDLSDFGVITVKITEPPVVSNTQMVREIAPSMVKGVWTQTWEVVDAPPEMISEWVSNAWVRLRDKRNSLLVESDWTQLADSPVDDLAWARYRQELRDLPANTTDPFNPIWPTKP